MTDLRTKTSRKRLPAKSAPYVMKLAEGRALLYRKRRADQPGRWLLRTYSMDGKYLHETLGTADDFAEADGKTVLNYAQAMSSALGKNSADPRRITVEDALTEWAEAKAATASTAKRACDYRSEARRLAAGFPSATLKSITAAQIDRWMREAQTRAQRATRNRSLANLKAALTRKADIESYDGPRGWVAAKKFARKDSFSARVVVLTEAQEDALIANAAPDLARLLLGLQMTGARVGELTAADIADLHGDTLTLTGKTGTRTITLSPRVASSFRQTAGNRTGPLFVRENGSAWPDGAHISPVAAAVAAADLPEDASAYSLRHGFISRALSRGVPPNAVAQHTGTSVKMIEDTYAKFMRRQFEEWFA